MHTLKLCLFWPNLSGEKKCHERNEKASPYNFTFKNHSIYKKLPIGFYVPTHLDFHFTVTALKLLTNATLLAAIRKDFSITKMNYFFFTTVFTKSSMLCLLVNNEMCLYIYMRHITWLLKIGLSCLYYNLYNKYFILNIPIP